MAAAFFRAVLSVRALSGVAIGLAIGVLATLAITSTDWLVAAIVHSWSRDEIQDWLGALSGWVGGFLAVAAAYATIRKMQATDEQQARHHADLMRLSYRADALIVERAKHLFGKTLRTATDEGEICIPALGAHLNDSLNVALPANTARIRLGNVIRKVNDVLKDDAYIAASTLFDAQTTAQHRILSDAVRFYFKEEDTLVYATRIEVSPNINGDRQKLAQNWPAIRQLPEAARAVADGIDNLVKRYRAGT